MPRRSSTVKVTSAVTVAGSEESTVRFEFEGAVVVRPIPLILQNQIAPAARYVVPPASDPADWALLVAAEKEQAKALKKANKNAQESNLNSDSDVAFENTDNNASVAISNASLVLGRGTVSDYTAASGRTPELWTVSYPTAESKLNSYTERITRSELVAGQMAADKILQSSLVVTSFPLSTIQKFVNAQNLTRQTIADRVDIGMETAIQHSILWKLILVAACEFEREHFIQKTLEESKKKLEMQLQEQLNKDKYNQGECPKYYSKHPTTYMGGHFVKESTDESLADVQQASCSLVPHHLGQRLRLGISKAYDYYLRIFPCLDYEHKDSTSILDTAMILGFEARRRSTRFNNNILQDQTGTDMDPAQSLLPKEHEPGGAVALAFLHLLDMIPQGVQTNVLLDSLETYEQYRQREQTSHEPVSVLDIQGHQDDDEEAINPFFMPSPSTIMIHLGRKQSSMTPADIQTAICYAVEDSIPCILSFNNPSILQTQDAKPTIHGQSASIMINNTSADVIVSLECISGDKVKDLHDYEPSSFSKSRFAIKKLQVDHIRDEDASRVKEERESRRKRELEKKQAELEETKRKEREWRLRKQYETWRFKSVQSGCTIWPSWASHVEEILTDIHKQSNSTLDDTSLIGNESCGIVEDEKVTQEDKDAEMASMLSLEINPGGNLTIGDGQRRSRRTNRDSTSEAISFYGSSTSLNPQQLLETVHRLVLSAYPKYITLMDLRKLLIDSHGESKGSELRRIRSAIGKLLFRLGKIGRIMVTTESDSICWTTLFGDGNTSGVALVQLGPSLPNVISIENKDITNIDEQSALQDDREHLDDDIIQDKNGRDNQLSYRDIDREMKEIKILEMYMESLHRIELALRFLLLKKYRNGTGLQFVTPNMIALAADEKDGDIEASDTKEIEVLDSQGKISWLRDPSHALMGQAIYRPNVDGTEPSIQENWYKVLDYTPSVKSHIDQSKTNSDITEGMRDDSFVERRIHFRAVSTSSIKNAPIRTIILNEAQVNAGIKAAMLETEFLKLSSAYVAKTHPFEGLDGLSFVLSPIDEGINFFCFVRLVGHDSYRSQDRKNIDYRIFLMVEETNDGGNNTDTPEYLKTGKTFWASLSADATAIMPQGKTTWIKIMPQEYHSSTPAYSACEAVIEYLKSNVKIMPFLKPVDPVALQIPTYFDVIKHPMDLSTVEQNLVKGEYGRIPPNETFSSSISKMLNGPFYSHIMRIFDNALVFNPPGDWIHNDAAQLKRLASKKIESLTLKAEREACPASGGTGFLKRNFYKEVDSDVDAYEYESDYEDDDNYGKRRKRRSTKDDRHIHAGRSVSKSEDNASRPIEGPVHVPPTAGIGIFAGLPISSDARLFGLPNEWSCRHLSPDADEMKKAIEEEERQRLVLLQMQLDQQSSTRRSSRSQDAKTDLLYGTKTSNGNEARNSLEYYLGDEEVLLLDDVSVDTVARTRVHLESIRETLHDEYFARLFYKYFTNNRSSPISATTFHYGEGGEHGLGYGMYTDNSFPPFLGRIVPIDFCPSAIDGDLKWEIRTPYIIPALRWVLRGLIQSGHLSEIEPLSNGLQDNIPVVSSDGVLLINHAYYSSNEMRPYDSLDVKEIARRKRSENAPIQEQTRLDVNLSDYEKARLERVERNKERLKLLGLA